MVVIDSEKHGLDWQRSERDHGILSLKEKYQEGKQRGAATLISKAKAEVRIPQRVLRPPSQGGPIDPHTGKKVYVDTGFMIKERKKVTDPVTGEKHYVETGKMVPKKDVLRKLEFATDAHSLIDRTQGTAMEVLYADHSNRLKAMANEARKESYHTKHAPTSSSAKAAYSKEVASLNSKVRVAEMNAPRERHAQLLTSVRVSQVRQSNPGMEESEVKKEKNRALNTYRARTGAGKSKITITQSEWNAIQAGAVSTNVLNKVIKHSDPDSVKHLALPKDSPKMTPTRKATATTMLASGYTQAEVADKLGVSVSTLKVSLTE
jgi:DNA-binding NarL/FixJ family response regulator